MSHSFLMLEQTHIANHFSNSPDLTIMLIVTVCNLLFKTKLKILLSDISVYIKGKKLSTTNISLYRVYFCHYTVYIKDCVKHSNISLRHFFFLIYLLSLAVFQVFFYALCRVFFLYIYNLFHIIRSMYKLCFVHNQVVRSTLLG